MCLFVCVCVPRKRFPGNGTATASDVRMHHVLNILTLTFIQCHPDRNHENNKYSIVSESVQAMPIMFAVRIVRLKFDIICSQSDDLALHPRSQLRLILDSFVTCTVIEMYRTVFQLWHSNLA